MPHTRRCICLSATRRPLLFRIGSSTVRPRMEKRARAGRVAVSAHLAADADALGALAAASLVWPDAALYWPAAADTSLVRQCESAGWLPGLRRGGPLVPQCDCAMPAALRRDHTSAHLVYGCARPSSSPPSALRGCEFTMPVVDWLGAERCEQFDTVVLLHGARRGEAGPLEPWLSRDGTSVVVVHNSVAPVPASEDAAPTHAARWSPRWGSASAALLAMAACRVDPAQPLAALDTALAQHVTGPLPPGMSREVATLILNGIHNATHSFTLGATTPGDHLAAAMLVKHALPLASLQMPEATAATVAQLMTAPAVCVARSMTIAAVAQLLLERQLRCAIV